MDINPIGVAVPFFFLLIGIEYWALRRKQRSVRLNDAITDMSCGLGDQSMSLLVKGAVLIPYQLAYQHVGIFKMPTNEVWTWVFGFMAVDFCYYWYHRFSHRVNIGWATHSVHHQSEEYNLSVALRQPWFSQFFSWAFYLPLAALGLPLEVYVTSFAFNLLYQFWIHTETIDKMGIFEEVFNTPSHHRVHHGTNPEYLDTNYAGVFIIWDRFFGTFKREEARVLYGTLKPLRSWNPIWANVGPWASLAALSRAQTSWADKVLVWFRPPEWTAGGAVDTASLFDGPERGYDRDDAKGVHWYIMLNLVLTGTCLGVLLTFEKSIESQWLYAGTGFVLLSLTVWAGLFEGKRWAWPLEGCRWAYLAVCAIVFFA